MFSEKQALDRAAAMGPSLRWVSSQPISTPEMEGMESVYEFADVNQLKLGTSPPALSGTASMPSAVVMNVGMLQLEKMPGGLSRLTVRLSEQLKSNPGSRPAPDAADTKASRVPTPEELEKLERARPLLGGMRFAVSVELLGKILISPSVPCLTENRIDLITMDMDKLLTAAGNSSLLSSLNTADPASLQKLMVQAGGIDGMKICMSTDLQVEFADYWKELEFMSAA